MDPALRSVDRALASISGQLTFIVRSTPCNLRAVFEDLSAGRTPQPYVYAPGIDEIERMQAELDAIDMDCIDDAGLHALLWRKHEELAIKLDMLHHLGSPRYLSGSLRLFGDVEDELHELARTLVASISPEQRVSAGPMLEPAEIASKAQAEIAYYADRMPAFAAEVRIRPGIAAGMMCSRGHLLIDAECQVTPQRIEALLHHEVGTHLLTYYNGLAQPLEILAHGLPGYIAMQEGLAVLAEYLSGGIDPRRLRIVACRVLATRSMLEGADLVQVYRRLMNECELSSWIAYRLASRVVRGGGLTKDAVYLRGLYTVLELLHGGAPLEPMYVGKISFADMALCHRLLERGALYPAPILPRFLSRPETRERIAKVRRGLALERIFDEDPPCV